MANTISLTSSDRSRKQFAGAFGDEMWFVTASITDQDAITAGDTASFALTIPGVALGDMVIGVSLTNDLSDGTDQAVVTAVVTAANTVNVRVQADAGAYAADDLNSSTVKIAIARPSW